MAEQKKPAGQQAKRPSVLEDKEEFTKDRVSHMGDKPATQPHRKEAAGQSSKKK